MNKDLATNNKKAITIALILTLTITALIVALPVANAHDPPWTVPTNAYVIATPNPIGVGQPISIVMWLDQFPPTAAGTTGPRWEGFKLDITKPDGTKETIGPFLCESAVGSSWVPYTPDQVGTYTIVFSWPGQTLANVTAEGIRTQGLAYVGDFFEGSTSEPLTLIVQQESIVGWQEPSLPTEYWQRPLHAANREWSQFASNWLGGSWLVNNFQSRGTAPESPHILWTKPITPALAGGINDAQWPGIPSDVNDYEAPWKSQIIMNGKIYYNTPAVADVATYGYYCRDMYTGEIIWYKNGTDNGLNNPWIYSREGGTYAPGYNLAQTYLGLTQGWLYHYHSVNGNGILSYLIMVQGSTWYFLDASTGNWLFTLINVPKGTAVTDQDGSLLRYSYDAKTGNLLCWNVSQSIPPIGPSASCQQQWKARFGATIDAVNDTTWTEIGTSAKFNIDEDDIRPRSGYTMNLTVQKGLPGSIIVLQDENRVPKMIFGSNVNFDAASKGLSARPSLDTFSAWAMRIDEHVAPYSPFPTKTNTQNTNLGFGATLLWYNNYTVPIPDKNYTWSIGGASYDDQVFTVSCKQTRQKWGYSLETGERIWGPTPSEGTMNYFGMDTAVYYGKILSDGYTGTLYAYDAKTGELLWTYNATNIGYESPYGENYPLTIGAVSDGKVYVYSSEHSPSKPLWRGAYLRCINITDGTELWRLLHYNPNVMGAEGVGLGIADGYIITASEYDNLIYCIGKGPSATSVTASPKVSVHGDSVLVEGMVTDISSGTKDAALAMRYPNGVPAMADADMQAWMEYLYMQQAFPADAKGVEVTLDTVDPNGNFINIGTVTSDMSGMFSHMFTPEVPGKYTIIATFEGSESYWRSTAETAIGVAEAPAWAQPIDTEFKEPEQTEPEPTEPEPTTPEPTEPEATEPAEAPFITTEVAIIAAVIIASIIGIASFWALKKRK